MPSSSSSASWETTTPDDYLTLWSEFHNVILPHETAERAPDGRLKWMAFLPAGLLVMLAVTLSFSSGLEPFEKAMAVSLALLAGILSPFFFLKMMSGDEDQGTSYVQRVDDRFRLFLTPEESMRLYSGNVSPATPSSRSGQSRRKRSCFNEASSIKSPSCFRRFLTIIISHSGG